MTIKEFVKQRKEELKAEFALMDSSKKFVIVQMNEDPASCAYIKGKMKDAAELGVNAELRKFPLELSEEELLAEIEKMNNDETVAGFIVQMPLPKQINEEHVKLAVSPAKDVDGFHALSELDPCTPAGIMIYLDFLHTEFVGKNAVVIGRSNIVGKPMARLLLARGCNVTVVHSKTSRQDMEMYIKHADIIVVAVGRQGLLDNSYEYNPNAIIVDVGINRDETGLHGDAVPDLPVRLQTPVPGGVGLLTRLALYENLLKILKK